MLVVVVVVMVVVVMIREHHLRRLFLLYTGLQSPDVLHRYQIGILPSAAGRGIPIARQPLLEAAVWTPASMERRAAGFGRAGGGRRLRFAQDSDGADLVGNGC